MAAREVEIVYQQFINCLGLGDSWDPEQFDQVKSAVFWSEMSVDILVES